MMPSINILVLNRLGEKELASIKDTAPDANIILAKPDQAADYIEDADILVTWGQIGRAHV